MKLISGKDLSNPLTEKEKVSLYWLENSYRRGYYQGYSQGMDDTEFAISYSKVVDFFNKKLFHWRYGKKDSSVFPPRIIQYLKER